MRKINNTLHQILTFSKDIFYKIFTYCFFTGIFFIFFANVTAYSLFYFQIYNFNYKAIAFL